MSHVRQHLTIKILTALALGIVLGVIINYMPAQAWVNDYLVNGIFDMGGKIFIKLLQLMVVPVVFVSLVCGACELNQQSRVGKLAIKTIGLYLCTTAIAVALAIGVSDFFAITSHSDLAANAGKFVTPVVPSLKETLLNMVPSNPLFAMVHGKMLQIIIFALLFGVAIAWSGEHGKRIAGVFQDFNQVVMNLIIMLMNLAPIGVFCLMLTTFAKFGFSMLYDLLGYILTVAFVLILHLFLTNSLLLGILAKLNPMTFFNKMLAPMMFAFSTSSSNASIPIVLDTVKDKLGVSKFVASFGIPLGATINMDGTAIMQGVATVFISHLYHIDIGVSGYLSVLLMTTIASVGTAGVPGSGVIILGMVFHQVGLPLEGIGLIMAVDRIVDMLRTSR